MAQDWITRAVEDIPDMPDAPLIVEKIRAAIVKHCPFQPDVAYMPVPRCDSCKHWTSHGNGYGDCHTVQNDHGTSADFGCVQWEAK